MIVDRLSDALTTLVFTTRHLIEGRAPDRYIPDPIHVDCPIHDKTLLIRQRTQCCNSKEYVLSAYVRSRKTGLSLTPWRTTLRLRRRAMRASLKNARRRAQSIDCDLDALDNTGVACVTRSVA